MRYCFLFFVTFCLTLNLSAQEKWTLQQCVDYAFKNNVSVKQADVQARISKITANQSLMNRYPTLTGGINASYQHGLNENFTTGTLENTSFIGGNMNVQTTYNIFNWNARKNTIIANNLLNKADQVGVDRARNDVALVVANAFLQVMLRREQARINEVRMDQSRFQLNLTRKSVKAGSQPELNAIQIEAQLAKDSSNVLQSRALIEQAIINLKGSINYDFALPFDIESPRLESIALENITELQPEVVYNVALNNQPIQKMYNLRIEASQYEIKAARGLMYPSLTAFGNLNTRAINSKSSPVLGMIPERVVGYTAIGTTKYAVYVPPSIGVLDYTTTPFFSQVNKNFGQAVGLALNFSVFNNHTSRAQYERARVNIDQLKLQQEQENLTLRTNIYNAYQDAYSSLEKYNASLRTVDYSQRAFDMARKRYDIGLLGTLDFIITQNNLYLAQIEAVSNRYDYVFKMKVLEFYKGQGIRL